MGRIKKFPDDELFDVVVDFENEKGTPFSRRDVAEFAKKNPRYNGKYLEIEDYHFNVQKAPNTSAEIDRWQRERSGMNEEGRNVLLYSDNEDEFFKLNQIAQKEAIARTRKYVRLKEASIRQQELKILDLTRTINDFRDLEKIVNFEIDKLDKEINNIKQIIKYFRETVDEVTQERLLNMKISYKDVVIQLEDTPNFLINKKEKLFNLDEQIKKVRLLSIEENGENIHNTIDKSDEELNFENILPNIIKL